MSDDTSKSQIEKTDKSYTPPSWATPPSHDCHLEVIKNGQIIETFEFSPDKLYFLVGKDPTVCDLVLQHESISRQHAAFQFGEHGELYIADLGSANKTKLNKKILEPRKFKLVPSGSTITFGASTRCYCFQGPNQFRPKEMESDELLMMRAESEARQNRKLNEKESSTKLHRSLYGTDPNESGISWGLGADEMTTNSETDTTKEPEFDINKETQHDKQARKLMDQKRIKEQKMTRMEEDIKRLRNKENQLGELTSGQQRALQSQESKMRVLENEIIQLDEEIHNRIRSRQAQKEHAAMATDEATGILVNEDADAKYLEDENEDENDEFYDRTVHTKPQKHVSTSGSSNDVSSADTVTKPKTFKLKTSTNKISKMKTNPNPSKFRTTSQFIKLRPGVAKGTQAERNVSANRIAAKRRREEEEEES